MSWATVTLQQVDDQTIPYIEGLLAEHGLPAQDVRSKPECFYIGYAGEDRIGIGGIEPYGTDGLLRSVAVEPEVRGSGFGTALCAALESRAQADGVETLYLLTTTASGFFEKQEYLEIERAEAPESIQQTTEFNDLCPTSATSMRKRL